MTKKSKRWTESDLSSNDRLRNSLSKLGLPVNEKRGNKKPKPSFKVDGNIGSEEEVKVKKKRQGVDVKPIFKSLTDCAASCIWTSDSLSIRLDGARLLTYNEVYSILQYRKFESMRYKKLCREVVSRALENPELISGKRPFFDGPTKWTVSRVGAKKTDRDALSVMFKHFLDALKKSGVISDDNPDIICNIETLHAVGSPEIIMTLTKTPEWVEPKTPVWDELVKAAKSKKTKK